MTASRNEATPLPSWMRRAVNPRVGPYPNPSLARSTTIANTSTLWGQRQRAQMSRRARDAWRERLKEITQIMGERQAWLAWSSGKDSSWALHALRQTPEVEVTGLLTVFTAHDRVFMHAVRRDIVTAQARSVGLPLRIVDLTTGYDQKDYERVLSLELEHARAEGVSAIAYGDLFLEDLRRHREEFLAQLGLTGLFPLWKVNTKRLAADMLEAGVEAYVTCLDPRKVNPRFAGKRWDADFLNALEPNIDPCGEYGEFHTLAVNGPAFSQRVPVVHGEIVQRDGFVFSDVILSE